MSELEPLSRTTQGCPGNERRLRNWSQTQPGLVMAVLDTAIHAFRTAAWPPWMAGSKSGHDDLKLCWKSKITFSIVQQFSPDSPAYHGSGGTQPAGLGG